MPFKTAKTNKEFRCKFGKGHIQYDLVVPVGSTVNNKTAMGCDDEYRFLTNFDTQVLTGQKSPLLAHDLTHYGLNIPAEYCEPYKKD